MTELTTDHFIYRHGNLYTSYNRLPANIELGDRFEVTSTHTRTVITFRHDYEAFMDNEGWDGEMNQYIPRSECKVKKLIIYPYESSLSHLLK